MAADTAQQDGYAGAVDHYLSPARRDAVKVHWEEPALRAIFADAVRDLAPTGPLRVLDIGCGVGDGLSLMRTSPEIARCVAGLENGLRYTGMDLNQELLDLARHIHAGDPHARFGYGDVRAGVPDADFDLIISCGVPYSHLTVVEMRQALSAIFASLKNRRAIVIIDVLGRYSIEWTTRWGQQRWPYRMSFFHTEQAAESTEMTTYGGADLKSLISEAAERSGCALGGITCHDRSIVVGRHTTTGDFAEQLRPYRTLVNELFDPATTVELDELLFDVPLPEAAPAEIRHYFTEFAESWNALIKHTRDLNVPAEQATSVVQPMLAHGLCRLEASTQAGLGVGHSLTAVVRTVAGK